MSVDIDHLDLDELYALNDRVIERIKHLEAIEARVEMMAFDLGSQVTFRSKQGRHFGTVVKFNRKTVVVLTEDGRQWRVSPNLLTPVQEVDESNSSLQAFKTLSSPDKGQ